MTLRRKVRSRRPRAIGVGHVKVAPEVTERRLAAMRRYVVEQERRVRREASVIARLGPFGHPTGQAQRMFNADQHLLQIALDRLALEETVPRRRKG